MKYLEPSFSTFAVGSDEYRDNWDAIFAKKESTEAERIEAVEANASAGEYADETPDLEEENKILWGVVRSYVRYERAATEENASLLAESKAVLEKRVGNKYQQKYFAITPPPLGASY